MRLVEIDEAGAVVVDNDFEAAPLHNLLGGGDDFGCDLLQGRAVAAVEKVQLEETVWDGGVGVLHNAESAFTDVFYANVLVDGWNAGKKKRRQLFPGKNPLFYPDGDERKQQDDLLAATGADARSGGRQGGKPGVRRSIDQVLAAACRAFFAERHHRVPPQRYLFFLKE
ncbi:MAG: hypothetical protein FWD79_09165 [Desulfobulbus sp.]|nr:hypothetical protein [Desulfobulbus sp.]